VCQSANNLIYNDANDGNEQQVELNPKKETREKRIDKL
jgi:hypothetical protein